MSDHYALEKMAHYQIAEYLRNQEQARLAAKMERAARQHPRAVTPFSVRGVLRALTLSRPFAKLNAITR